MTVARVLTTWDADATLIALLAALAVAYLAAARRTRRWPAARTAAFIGGLATLALALMSGLDVYAGSLLSVHMAEHVVLTLVAAPLIVAGAPITLALRATHGDGRAALARLVRGRAGRAVSYLPVAFLPLPLAIVATHLSGFYQYTLEHGWAHELEHAAYFAAAVLFFTPVVASEPLPRRLGGLAKSAYLIAGMVPMTVVAAVLMSGGVRYAAYAHAAPALGISALSDQRLGAALMWGAGVAVIALIGLPTAWRAWAEEERRARAHEAYADRLPYGGDRLTGAS